MTAETTVFRFGTDTATLVVFDPAKLAHRLSDDADWWSLPSEELQEINRANVLFVGLHADGYYTASVSISTTVAGTGDSLLHAVIHCESGRLFVGPAEQVSSAGLEPDEQYGGRYIWLEPGLYGVHVAWAAADSISIQIAPANQEARNAFTSSPSLPECSRTASDPPPNPSLQRTPPG